MLVISNQSNYSLNNCTPLSPITISYQCENTHIATIRYSGTRVFKHSKVGKYFWKLYFKYLPGARLMNSEIPPAFCES